jgi:2-amino-4-hydroxy-6-hydroxymethyldihydropteridine diphosphokinase
MPEIVYLSLGSNLGNREANLAGAITILSDQVEIENLKSASFYESEPLDNTDQPLFLNTALELLTSFSPFELLDKIHETETLLGRPKNREKNAPRVIDIDILCYGNAVMETSELTIPHPKLQNRKFVLIPFQELAPQFVVNTLNLTVSDLLQICSDNTQVVKHIIETNA